MISIKSYSVVGLVLIAVFLLPLPSFSQKKKKAIQPVNTNVKHREAEFYFTEGEKYFILEDYAKALLYYQRSLEVFPDNPAVHYKIAEVLSKTSKHEDLLKASISIENAIRLDKTNKYFYILAGTIYNGLGRYDKAAQSYETMLIEVKGSDEYLYELASIYQYARKFDDAIKTYNRAEAIFGVNEMSSVQKLKLYFDSGKIKEGIAEGEKLLSIFPGEERYVMGFAEVLAQKNQQQLAITYLEKFIKENEGSGNAKMLLAGLYRDLHQEEKARPLLLSVFSDTNVEFGSKVIVLGIYNAELNQSKNSADTSKINFALKLYRILSETYPQESNVYILGGDLYLATGNNREAVKEYQAAIKSGDVNFEVWQNLLYLEVKLEQFDKVIEHSEEALEMFPNQGMIHYFHGFAHLRKRHFEDAILSFEQAKRLSGSNPALIGEINSMLGDAYNATKQYDKSDKAYEEALAINPNNDIVLNNYSYFLALRKANLEKAEKMAAQLIKNNPDNPTFLDTYAWVLYVREKYKEAKKIIERAVQSGKANAAHFEHYGDILFKLGDTDGAVAQWEKARKTDANNDILNKKIANRKIYE